MDRLLDLVLRRHGVRGTAKNLLRHRRTPPALKISIQCVEVLIAGWVCLGWSLPKKDGFHKSSYFALASNLFSSARLRPQSVLDEQKKFYHKCRELSLMSRQLDRKRDFCNIVGKLIPKHNMVNKNQLYQLSCLARCLPFPTKERIAAETEEYITRQTTPRDLPSCKKLLQGFCKYDKVSRSIIKSFRKRIQNVNPTSRCEPFASSACAGWTRREGGRVAHLVSTGQTLHSEPEAVLHRSVQYWKTLKCNKLVTKYPRESVNPHVEVVAVPERGNKVRMVTKNNPYRVAMANGYRNRLYPLVVGKSQTTVTDKPPALIGPLGNFSKEVRGRYFILSLDLKASSDYIRFEVLEFLAHKLGIDPKLIYDELEIDGEKVVQGAPMGLPLTWALLDWLVSWCARTAEISRARFRTRGDDMIGFVTEAEATMFIENLEALGFVAP